jgi:thiamine-monophosphate kinase
MNEFELIGLLTTGLPSNDSTILGAGDDCAVIELGLADRWLLFKTDAVVEGIHYTATTEPEKVGRKALARCLSDVAAMAGKPVAALVTLGLPREHDPKWAQAVYAGMSDLARHYGVAIVGGETTTVPERTLLSVALLGTVDKTTCIKRSGAVAGDAIFVTGELGGSIRGKHLDFEPRIEQAQWLATHFSIHAMIDISDGLAGDLRHITNSSGVGAELLADAIPISAAARKGSKPPMQAALEDGEDFELLFTVPARVAVALLDAWKLQFSGLKLSCIGKITKNPGFILHEGKRARDIQEHGYTHFA